MKKVITVAIVLASSATMYAEDGDHAALARGSVAAWLSDKNVFVCNPPADLNPYKDMSREEMQRFQRGAMKDGSLLFLHLNGLPARFESRKDFKEHGLHKTWYQNGRVRSEENYEDGKLITGVYLDKSGAVLGEIEKGTGVKTIFGEPLDESGGSIRGTADYVDGLKHGTEVLYRDHERRLKFSEAQYKEGKLHGVKTSWMSTGEKNLEEHYKDGRPHGKSTCWYKNGQIQSTKEYATGQLSASTMFYENGVKAEETSDESRRRWYPSGQLMLQKTFAKWGKVSSGRSFDSLGSQNGSVTDGTGSLIGGDGASRYGNYQLFIYEADKTSRSIQLPRPSASYHFGGTVVNLTLRLEAPHNATWAKGAVSIILPADCKSEGPLQFETADLKSGFSTTLGPVVITLPQPPDKWAGKVLVDVQGLVNGHTVRYQHRVLKQFPKADAPPQPTRPKRKPKPRRTPMSLRWRRKSAPQVEGRTIPPYSQAVDYWRQAKTVWVLYKFPPVLLTSRDSGSTWQISRSDFGYRPCGLYVLAEDSILLWGTRPTRDVSKGIAHVVEKSRDGGKSWSPFKIPDVDFLLGISGSETTLIVSAIRIPKNGIPTDKHWFEMPRTTFLSKGGTNFTELVGPSFFDIGQVHAKSTAPNGRFRAFLSVSSWLDTSFTLYWASGMDEVPVWAVAPETYGDIVWSANSRILTVRHKGEFVAYVDTMTGESERADFAYERANSEKEKAELAEFDKRVGELMKKNAEPRAELDKE